MKPRNPRPPQDAIQTETSRDHRSGYRLDIDGLRAIAVASVVLYHVGVPGITGGFVGVDVFFVLSGYLITGQLYASREQRFRSLIADFYARRARRILPSLGVVVVVCLIAGKLLLLPDGEQQELALSGIASSLFVSNMYFWHQSGGYFAGPAELQPLLHTWSLAVEEQFYLFWPLFLPALWFFGKKWSRARPERFTLGGVLAASLASLAISILLTWRSPGAAFFMMPSRLWELGLGAALAIKLRERAWKLPSALSLAGLAGILLAVFLYSKTTRFPGVAALLPVLGTGLVIAAGAQRREGLAYRLLASRPMTLTGELSYSWYLWHWPLLAIARALDLGAHKLPRDLALVGVAFVLAYVSTRYFENPIRKKQVALLRSRAGALMAGAGILVATAVFSVIILNRANRFYRAELAPASLPCMLPHGVGLIIYPLAVVEDSSHGGSCTLAEGTDSIAFLVGDSHANHWSPALAMLAKESNVHAVERSFGSCPVLLAHQKSMKNAVGLAPDCRTFSEKIMTELTTGEVGGEVRKEKRLVVLSLSWSYWDAYWPTSNNPLGASLDEALSDLDVAGAKVLLIGPTPRFDYVVPACVSRRSTGDCRIARAQYDAKAAGARRVLAVAAASHGNVKLWDPAEQFCNADYCETERDGFVTFRDEHHLSRRGAELAVPALRSTWSSLLAPGGRRTELGSTKP
jgi:peptidoglycan/LPS O-acetylase OafA/YrhL